MAACFSWYYRTIVHMQQPLRSIMKLGKEEYTLEVLPATVSTLSEEGVIIEAPVAVKLEQAAELPVKVLAD